MNKKLISIPILVIVSLLSTACSTDSEVVSDNLSKAADQFEINRRIIFYNTATDRYMMTIEGRCSIKHENNQLEVTCKTQGNEFKKHFLGLSMNISYTAEQLEAASVDSNHYRVIFKPEVIIPDIDRP